MTFWMTRDVLVSSQPSAIQAIRRNDEYHEAGDGDACVHIGSHEGCGQNRCRCCEGSEN